MTSPKATSRSPPCLSLVCCIISTTRPGETSLWHRHSENTLYVCVEHAAAALNRPTDKVRNRGVEAPPRKSLLAAAAASQPSVALLLLR